MDELSTLADELPALAAILVSPQGRAVLAAGEPGKVVKLFRVARGWIQQELAERVGCSQSTISRIEDGASRAAQDMKVLARMAEILDIPRAALGLATQSDQSRTLDDMDRRELLTSTVALAAVALLPHGVATAGQITTADVTQCWTAVRRLQELDVAAGGAPVFQTGGRHGTAAAGRPAGRQLPGLGRP